MQGWASLPEKYLVNVQSISEKNPGYQIIRWDDRSMRDMVRNLGETYLQKYDSFQTIHQKVDFGRYAVLYALGGISVDVDVMAHKGFDDTPFINEKDFIVSYNSSSAFENYVKHGRPVSLNNATILVSKRHPIMKGLLDHIMTLSCEIGQSKESCIQETTGPREFTTYLNQFKDQITILDSAYFEPCSGSDMNCEIKPVSILDHRHEGSWLGENTKKFADTYYKIKKYKWPILIVTIIIILFIIHGRK